MSFCQLAFVGVCVCRRFAAQRSASNSKGEKTREACREGTAGPTFVTS